MSASINRGDGVWQNCHMELVISADAVLPQAVPYDGLVHRNRWPSPGMALPGHGRPRGSRVVHIEWDDMPTSRERAQDSAQALAAAMGGRAAGASAGRTCRSSATCRRSATSSGRSCGCWASTSTRLAGAAGGGASPGPAAAGRAREEGADDDARLARLERLAALRAQGMLTDEEFEEQKRRILDEAARPGSGGKLLPSPRFGTVGAVRDSRPRPGR